MACLVQTHGALCTSRATHDYQYQFPSMHGLRPSPAAASVPWLAAPDSSNLWMRRNTSASMVDTPHLLAEAASILGGLGVERTFNSSSDSRSGEEVAVTKLKDSSNSTSSKDSDSDRTDSNSAASEDSILTSPAARALIELGYSRNSVKRAALLLQHTEGGVTTESLLDMISMDSESDSEDTDSVYGTDNEEEHSDEETEDAAQRLDSGIDATVSSEHFHSTAEQSEHVNSRSTDSKQIEHHETHISEEFASLLEENQRLKGISRCKVCLEAEVATLFLPCRHLVCCQACTEVVKDCPVCRQRIMGTVKTYMA